MVLDRRPGAAVTPDDQVKISPFQPDVRNWPTVHLPPLRKAISAIADEVLHPAE